MEKFKVIEWLGDRYEVGDAGTFVSTFGNKRKVMKQQTSNSGYLRINIMGKKYYSHRLVYEAHVGPIPEGMQVDHVNGVKTDNRISNLECVTNRENIMRYRNSDRGRCRSSGHPGVYWDEQRQKWRVCLHVGGTRLHLGRFDPDKFDEACAAQEKAYAEEVAGNLSPELRARLDRLIENRLKRKKAS